MWAMFSLQFVNWVNIKRIFSPSQPLQMNINEGLTVVLWMKRTDFISFIYLFLCTDWEKFVYSYTTFYNNFLSASVHHSAAGTRKHIDND